MRHLCTPKEAEAGEIRQIIGVVLGLVVSFEAGVCTGTQMSENRAERQFVEAESRELQVARIRLTTLLRSFTEENLQVKTQREHIRTLEAMQRAK